MGDARCPSDRGRAPAARGSGRSLDHEPVAHQALRAGHGKRRQQRRARPRPDDAADPVGRARRRVSLGRSGARRAAASPTATRSCGGSTAARSRKVCAPEVTRRPRRATTSSRPAPARGRRARPAAGSTRRGVQQRRAERGTHRVASNSAAGVSMAERGVCRAAPGPRRGSARLRWSIASTARATWLTRRAGDADLPRSRPPRRTGCPRARPGVGRAERDAAMTDACGPSRDTGRVRAHLWTALQAVDRSRDAAVDHRHAGSADTPTASTHADDRRRGAGGGQVGVQAGELVVGELQVGRGGGVDDRLRPGGAGDRDDDVGLREVPGQRHPVDRDAELVGHLRERRRGGVQRAGGAAPRRTGSTAATRARAPRSAPARRPRSASRGRTGSAR